MIAIGWPQGIVIALILIGVGISMAKDGEPRDPHNAKMTIFCSALTLFLLWWGGFFGGAR